ncbi:hypothetical protein HanPSC8_Chr02g0057641 [Helianthus annuus]|nr:hypothetical protein HanHA89_Chr02g0051721 [Helianthus annuus]KAJ0776772.1 hypothetical protein HanLR1_Chr02g0049471 [Helianthus annuus]KAJ0951239.1 hypothetical protein HanPSC8_Chr02g0057641 [Helianthus annuus]
MAPGKDNLSQSFSVLTQKQFDNFLRDYRILELPARDKPIYPFLYDKFPFYTCVCNFANYRVPFTKFLIKVLRFFRVHLSKVNPFGLSRINHFEISCRALGYKPDLSVFRSFYEFITDGDWYTFAHRKGIPSPDGDEKSSLKNRKDNFFWLDDLCLSAKMAWRFKDQSMDFELGENFVFNQNMAWDLIDNRSPIRPVPKHIFLLDRVSHFWDRGDKEWLMICRKGVDAQLCKFGFDFVEEDGDGEPFIKQIAPTAYKIRPPVDPKVSSKDPAGLESGAEMAGSSRVQVTVDPLVINEDSD